LAAFAARFGCVDVEKKTMKSEARNPKQIQMTKIQNPKRDCFASAFANAAADGSLAMTATNKHGAGIKIILPLDFWPVLAQYILPFLPKIY
jgi:hypothetical protein